MGLTNQATSPEAQALRVGWVYTKGQGSFSSWGWKAKLLTLTEQALVTSDYKIPLSHISKVERVDLKPFCLLLETKNKRYYLSFDNDKELYDWQDDIYSRCPLIGAGKPYGFVHNVHVGADSLYGTTALPYGWSEILSNETSSDSKRDRSSKRQSQIVASPLQDTPTLPYNVTKPLSGDKGAPSPTILDGHHSIKDDGLFTGWIWRARWLVLGPRTLTIYKSKRSTVGVPIKLHDITKLDRAEARAHCLQVETCDEKRYLLSFKNDDQLHSWRDAIYARSRLAGISNPVNFVHHVHIGIDAVSGEFTGLPDHWRSLLQQNLPRRPGAPVA